MMDGMAVAPAWGAMTGEQVRRWTEVLDHLAAMVPAGAPAVLVDGAHAGVVADRLAEALHTMGRPCARLGDGIPVADEDAWRATRAADTVALADGPRWRTSPPTGHWDLVIWVRGGEPAAHGERDVPIVVDLRDPGWPVIRHVRPQVAGHDTWYVTESRAFFAVRAKTWDRTFGDDLPAYADAVAEGGLHPGGAVVDAGCGTGRALPALRAAVGPSGVVVGLDVTPEMLAVARESGPAGRPARAVPPVGTGRARRPPRPHPAPRRGPRGNATPPFDRGDRMAPDQVRRRGAPVLRARHAPLTPAPVPLASNGPAVRCRHRARIAVTPAA
jgi:hypothetical protein